MPPCWKTFESLLVALLVAFGLGIVCTVWWQHNAAQASPHLLYPSLVVAAHSIAKSIERARRAPPFVNTPAQELAASLLRVFPAFGQLSKAIKATQDRADRGPAK